MRKGSLPISGILVALMAIAMQHPGDAWAQAGAYTVTNSRLLRPSARYMHVVRRGVADPAAVVSREVAEQPVHEHLVEVRMINTTVWLDPQKQYIRRGSHYKIDHNHSIPAAARLARSLLAGQAHTVWGSGHLSEPAPQVFQPQMILLKPQFEHAPKARPKAEPKTKDTPLFASAGD